jgi:hypothetical protein
MRVSANEVTAEMFVAPPPTNAMGTSRSVRSFVMTSSTSHLEDSGSTIPDNRLTSMSASPTPRRRRWAQISACASRHAVERVTFFFGSTARAATGAARRRSPP